MKPNILFFLPKPPGSPQFDDPPQLLFILKTVGTFLASSLAKMAITFPFIRTENRQKRGEKAAAFHSILACANRQSMPLLFHAPRTRECC